jgi:hypothetical protein
MFSGRTRGGYDWITHQAFLSEEMADEGSDIFRNLFGVIIQTYEVYGFIRADFIRASEASFHSLTNTNKEYREFWMNGFHHS